MRLVIDVAQRFKIPIIPHFFDDWLSTQYADCPFGRQLRHRMSEYLNLVLAYAPLRMTISEAMSEEYRRRYGGDFREFGNCLEAGERTDGVVETS